LFKVTKKKEGESRDKVENTRINKEMKNARKRRKISKKQKNNEQ